MVAHVVTALAGPINELEQRILDSMPAIERWFRLEWMEHTPVFYSAVSVRNAGFKLAPVSVDLFPSCWNNLLPCMLPLAAQAATVAVEKFCPAARNLLIVPENKARNTFYLDNLIQLRRIFQMAGLQVRIGSISPDVSVNATFDLPDGESITLEPVMRSKARLVLQDFDPCTILLNSDLRSGVPGILEDLNEQFLLPPLHASRPLRGSGLYFKYYEDVARGLGKLIGIDPWLITPLFVEHHGIDLDTAVGMQTLSDSVDALLAKIKKVYKEYGIREAPFVVLKINHNHQRITTFIVRDAKDLTHLKLREHGARRVELKGPLVCDFFVQEGVISKERLDTSIAESVIYTLDRYVVGGFYRMHANRGMDESLNVPGSSFAPLAFTQGVQLPQRDTHPEANAPNRFYIYGVVSRLAMLAASYELEATDPQAQYHSS